MTDRIRTERLTPQLRRWVTHPGIGLQATLAFVQSRGGEPFKVPTQAAGSVLERIVGRTAAEAFVELHGGETLSVPKADQILRQIRNADICARRHAGEARRTLAREYDLTVRQIDNIYGAAGPAPSPQRDLFGGL